MTDYAELIRSLRNCSNNRCTPCDCGWFNKYQVDESCKEIIMWKAAAAIEALQAENADIREELFISQRKYDEFTTIASMQNAMLAKQLPKRGKWKITTENFTPELICSKCGVHIPCVAGWCMDAHMNYCPNCGAKMTGEQDVE